MSNQPEAAAARFETWVDCITGVDPQNPAVISFEGRRSYRDLVAHAAAAAAWLRDLVPDGTAPVPALLTSNFAALALTVGGSSVRRPIAPLGPKLTPAELASILTNLGSSVLVTEAAFASVAQAAAQRAGIDWVQLPELSASHEQLRAPDPAEIAFVLHTSGTSGQPKPVPVPHHRLARRVEVNAALVELAPGRTYSSASTFHHIAGLGMYAVVLGAGAAAAPMERFTVEEWQRLEELSVTNALLVPTMIEMLLAEGALGFEGLRFLHYGASPIHPETMRTVREILPSVRLVQLFGQTEGSPIAVLTPEDHDAALERPELLRSVGRAAPGVTLRIERPDDSGVGEVWARGDHLHGMGEDGWLHTGDLGEIDEAGYLFLAGRLGDRIIRGGENIYPIEIEQVLLNHPAVADAAIVGVPDRRWGETVKAVIVPAEGVGLPDVEELHRFVRDRLAGYKVPAEWSFLDELPRNANGKVLKRLLRG